jgi:hypothetical protein
MLVSVRAVGKFALPFGLLFMYNAYSMKSINVKQKKRGRGRPATGQDPVRGVRLSDEMVEEIDTWGASHDPPLGRSEAIRELIKRGLAKRTSAR